MLRRILVPLFALIVAGGTAMLARQWLEQQRPQPVTALAAPQPEMAFKMVLVAAGSMPIGSIARSESFRWQEWPDVDVPKSYFVQGKSDPSGLDGAVVRRDVIKGDPIVADALIRPGDRGFLAAILEPGMRAITVPVDDAASNAGLVFPGDRVDLILTQAIAVLVEGGPERRRRVSETVLSGVRVLAMGKRIETSLSGDGEADKKSAKQTKTATLEVTPRGAEMVALVSELGKLSLSLRGVASDDRSEDELAIVPTWDSDVSQVLASPPSSPGSAVVVMRGSKKQTLDIAKEPGQ